VDLVYEELCKTLSNWVKYSSTSVENPVVSNLLHFL
jgi:hypothetical protein